MGKEKSKKEKEKSKNKKEKKDKKHKKHRKRSSSDSSDSDGSVERPDQQLARERAAVLKLRDILATFPAVRKDLREMLWRVDQDEAANISGVPDPDLKANLAQLLELLRLRRNDKGIYGLVNRSEKILPVVGFVFDEPPRPRPQPAAASAPASAVPASAVPASAVPASAVPASAVPAPAVPAPAVAAPAVAVPAPATAAGQDDSQSAFREAGKAEPLDPQCRTVGPIGPARPEPAPGGADGEVERIPAPAEGTLDHDAAAAAVAAVKDEAAAQEDAGGAVGPAPRRVAGPAMPPRELLEAAAAAADALRAAGPPGTAGLSYGDSDDDDGLLVGPPPPELVEELDAAPQDEREAEVVRIIKVLREHNAGAGAAAGGAPAKLTPPGGPESAADAYLVLGLDPAVSGGEVKKRYMRLSLLIHPDKCGHPMAHEAFQAVAGSAKVLQDSGLRSALDERRADAELRRKAEAAAAQMERERAWRVARGEEAPATMAGPIGPSGPQRETWMTELPPEMSSRPDAGGVSQVSVRAFSQRGKTGRGDTSAWTDTPEQRKAREAQALLAAASQAYVQALPGPSGTGVAGGGGAGGSTAAAALDSFNAGSRKKSLMEVHLELQEKANEEARVAKKAAKKKQKTGDGAKGAGGAQEVADGGSDWPWRPFDRERDLEIRPRAKTGADIVKSAAALGSKFSGGGTQRHFL